MRKLQLYLEVPPIELPPSLELEVTFIERYVSKSKLRKLAVLCRLLIDINTIEYINTNNSILYHVRKLQLYLEVPPIELPPSLELEVTFIERYVSKSKLRKLAVLCKLLIDIKTIEYINTNNSILYHVRNLQLYVEVPPIELPPSLELEVTFVEKYVSKKL